MTHRTSKRIAIGAAIGIVFLCIALTGVSEYFLQFALLRSTHPYDVEAHFSDLKERYPWASTWADSIRSTGALRDTCVEAPNGLLHAWYVEASTPTPHTAVLLHGYKDNPIRMMAIGYIYHHELGWNILLPDQVAHAESEGDYIQMGWLDRLAAEQWLAVAHERFQSDTMVVHGVSMGAATVMCVAGDSTGDYVRAFIEDCGYTSVWDEFAVQLKNQFGLPSFPILHATSLVCKAQLGWDFWEASSLLQVQKCRKPMLFIHGDSDDFVPTPMVYRLYEAASCPKDLWIAPHSQHATSYADHPEEYTSRVKLFLEQQGLLGKE